VWARLQGWIINTHDRKTWNSGENIFPVRVERKTYQYLYKDDTVTISWTMKLFEQIAVNENLIEHLNF
jgi:elongation factor P